MKKFLILACLSTHSIFALLPPLWESVSQIKAILSSEDLKDYLDSGELIEAITRNEDGYTIKTNHSELKATVKAVPKVMPGPAEYVVEFN